MKRMLLLPCLLFTLLSFAETIIVKNGEELAAANKKAKAGDIVILKNGIWKDIFIMLDCEGTAASPITFRAETAGKVIINGQSKMKLGGSFIIVEGLLFTNGYAGSDAVIDFKINKNKLANNCRITNCVIDDFNNPQRMSENYWISFSGKNNRLDHCSFRNKKNMGVLLAVLLDDDRSRENFHSIDHNHFGRRPPLASNSGEIIRVGVSQHCQFNSNTQITGNFFESCDGETEIVSIKSGSNVVRDNVFQECQGGVVLRHGDFNTVSNNIFLGNNKEGTGGVRIINKGQWVVNNYFSNCRGVDFRSPLSIMNGVPNSPAFRYVQVTDAVIANNTFANCAAVSFCEGSDTERSKTPDSVLLLKNLFYNDRDSIIYRVFDDISGIGMHDNQVSKNVPQQLIKGFVRSDALGSMKSATAPYIQSREPGAYAISDSLQKIAKSRVGFPLSAQSGFSNMDQFKKIYLDARTDAGAKWFATSSINIVSKRKTVYCGSAKEVYAQLALKKPVTIILTGSTYSLQAPFIIATNVAIIGRAKPVQFKTEKMQSAFVITGNGSLLLSKLDIDGSGMKSASLVSNDSTGLSNQYNFSMRDCTVKGLSRDNGCKAIFFAHKYMVADSIVIRNNAFSNNNTDGFLLQDEQDNKGYYSAERIDIGHNLFTRQDGVVVSVYRGGNDESTMGPNLSFSHNRFLNCSTPGNQPLVKLTGVQVTNIFSNQFQHCNPMGNIIVFKDAVRARHTFEKNKLTQSGGVETNKFVTSIDNTIN